MSIIIKELFPSDPLSAALEKINFNFDQLILAGGGPPGPAGPIGPQGIPGPLGQRGDNWFVGASALGQTANHDGGVLRVEDHFLDSLGDVYSYFDILGSTGWTASGVNLKGPTGPTGITGGSDDVQIQAGGSGNAVTPIGGGYGPQASTVATSLIDFWFPRNMSKNSIFVGDIDWSVNYLQNFGSDASAVTDQSSVPQFTIIQKNVNSSGLNGLMLGAYGATTGATSSNLPEGSTGSTTSIFDFVHFGFAKPLNSAGFDRMFRIKTFRQKFRIEVGGPGTLESLTSLDLASRNFSWVNNVNGQFLTSTSRQSISTHDLETYSGGIVASAIELNTKPNLSGSYVNHTYGIIGLQTQQGIAPTIGNFNPLHGFGNVHIGSTAGLAGVRIQNGLGIQRPIDFGSGNNDASIRFYGGESLGDMGEWGYIGGGIRLFKQSITNTSGTTPIRAIQFGSGYTVGGTPTPATQSRQVGGRIGINNHPGWNDFNAARSINFPVHFNLGGYYGIDRAESPFPGQPAMAEIEQWALGVDYAQITGGESGIYHAGWDNDSPGLGIAYSHGYSGATGSWSTRNIILQSYYVNTTAVNPYTGRRTPNLYSQVGEETTSGNLGLGFAPKAGVTLSGTEAWSKLSVNGSITIGNIANGYHQLNALRPTNGILIQGAILQGATSSINLFDTLVYGSTGVVNSIGALTSIKISSDGNILGEKIIARGKTTSDPTFALIPHFSLPDLRTGFASIPGQTGRGYLTVPSSNIGGTYGSGPTSGITSVAYSSIRGDNTSTNPAPAFVNERRFVKATPSAASGTRLGRTYNLQDLVDRGFSTIYNWVGGAGSVQLRKSWLMVPSDTSTVILDLSRGASFGAWSTTNTWIPPNPLGFNVYPQTERFMNGNTFSYTSQGQYNGGAEDNGNPEPYASIRGGSYGLTIEPGRYEGQELTIIIKDVHKWNSQFFNPSGANHLSNAYLRFKTEDPLESLAFSNTASTPSSSTNVTGVSIQDSLVMAGDFYATQSIYTGGLVTTEPILASNTGVSLNGHSPAFWAIPHPMGALASGSNSFNVTSPIPLVGNAGSTSSIYTNLLVANRLNQTTNAVGWHMDIESGVLNLGTGGTLLLMNGWRIINFIWLSNSTYSGINQSKGAWVETGREFLAPRGTRNYSPSAF
jgi:hypothetical protein